MGASAELLLWVYMQYYAKCLFLSPQLGPHQFVPATGQVRSNGIGGASPLHMLICQWWRP